MSYEGYEQIICKNGHYCEVDCYDLIGEFKCDQLLNGTLCGAGIKESNPVDDTNFESYGRREVEEIDPPVWVTCNLGHQHIISEPTFKFCSDRLRWDQERDRFVEVWSE